MIAVAKMAVICYLLATTTITRVGATTRVVYRWLCEKFKGSTGMGIGLSRLMLRKQATTDLIFD